jgi:hypothetical protein
VGDDCSTSPQPRLQAVVGPLGACEPVDGTPVPDRRVPMLAALGHPAEPRSSRLTTPTLSSSPCSPASRMSSCSWQLPGQPPSSHSSSPQIVATDSPWAVWARRLVSYRTFWLAHPQGRCTRVASPSTHTASPDRAISTSSARRSSRVVTKLPSGWQKPRAPSGPSSRSRLSPTSVLQDADHAAGAPVRQPVQQHRGDRVQADLQAKRRGAALAERAGWGQVGQAGGQPGQHACGQRRTRAVRHRGPDLRAGVRHLADGLVPVNVRPHRASRTP